MTNQVLEIGRAWFRAQAAANAAATAATAATAAASACFTARRGCSGGGAKSFWKGKQVVKTNR